MPSKNNIGGKMNNRQTQPRPYFPNIYTVCTGHTKSYCGGIVVSRLEGLNVLDYELYFPRTTPKVRTPKPNF